MIRFILNNKEVATNLPAGMVILDFIRYHQHLMGTKIGCREGDCGACTVLVGEIKNGELEYRSMTSCLMPLGNVHGKHIVTVEGINFPDQLNPVQLAMAEEGATQCGFCTPGFVMSLAGFCLSNKEATKENAIAAVDGNICRCTGYKSIERACGRVSDLLKERNGTAAEKFAAEKKILPEYFNGIKSRLLNLQNGQLPTPDAGALVGIPTGHAASELPTPLGGGTDLYVQKHDEMTHASIRFLFDQQSLKEIRREGNKIFVGPSATVTDLKNSDVIQKIFPQFNEYAWLVSSTPIRNMATVAGNFINASPIGDFTIFFLALDAKVDLTPNPSTKERGTRTVPLRSFYKGYKQLDKKPEEVIENIFFEIPTAKAKFNFEKLSKRTNLDIASVNSAMSIEVEKNKIMNVGISAGGVAPVPTYLKKTSEFLKGKEISEETVLSAIEIMQSEISPISDARGSAEYKRLLLGQLIKAHFIKLFPEKAMESLVISR